MRDPGSPQAEEARAHGVRTGRGHPGVRVRVGGPRAFRPHGEDLSREVRGQPMETEGNQGRWGRWGAGGLGGVTGHCDLCSFCLGKLFPRPG